MQDRVQPRAGVRAGCVTVEGSVGAKVRLLNEVGRADSGPQLVVQLGGCQQAEIITIRLEQLTKAVESTLGPKGMNAMIDLPVGTPIVSRDGVSIAAYGNWKRFSHITFTMSWTIPAWGTGCVT